MLRRYVEGLPSERNTLWNTRSTKGTEQAYSLSKWSPVDGVDGTNVFHLSLPSSKQHIGKDLLAWML